MEKLLVMSNVSFSHCGFKRLVQQTRKNQGLFGKGLTTQKSSAFKNPEGKGESAVIFSFSHGVFYPVSKTEFVISGICNCFLFGQGQAFVVWKTISENEKMPVTSIFSFSLTVFYPHQNRCHFLSHNCFVVCNLYSFNLVKSKILSVGHEFLVHCW